MPKINMFENLDKVFFEGHVILRKLENFIDVQVIQFNFQNNKELFMKFWGMIYREYANGGLRTLFL